MWTGTKQELRFQLRWCSSISSVKAAACCQKRQFVKDISEMLNGRKHICSREEKQVDGRPWSDLPVDILNFIIGQLPKIIDRIRFRAVCKNWHLAEVQYYERNLPWLLAHSYDTNNGGDVALISYLIPFPNQNIKRKMESEEQEFFGAGVCASKYGWLLLQQSSKAYLYNPFSRKTIKLPKMEIDFNRATFSSSPTSPDCICFAIQSSKSSDKIRISICFPGDVEWYTISMDGFNKAVEDVVYINGNFYCVFSGGVLGAFYYSSRDWSVLTDMKPIIGIQFWSRLQLVDSNGELLLVCCSDIFHIFRFDWSKMAWEEMHKLGNQVLFLGCTSFAIPAEGKASALADRIYYHGEGQGSHYYHMRRRQKNACRNFYPWLVPPSLERIWIDPPPL